MIYHVLLWILSSLYQNKSIEKFKTKPKFEFNIAKVIVAWLVDIF